jgi:hypothetical protein
MPGRRLRPAPRPERPLHRARETVERPRPPGHDRVPRRPGAAAERPPPAGGLLGARLPLRQQRPRPVLTAPGCLGEVGMPRSGRMGGRGRAARGAAAGGVPAPVLHALDREREPPVLQSPRHPVAAAGITGPRRVHRALPAARPGPDRLPRPAGPAQARDAVRGPAPGGPGDHHPAAPGCPLGRPQGPRRRRGIAAGPVRRRVAAAGGQRQEPGLPGVPAVRPRDGRGAGRGHRLGSRVPP